MVMAWCYKIHMNNTDLPEGWAMPPKMAKRVNDSVHKKPSTLENQLQKALDEMARDIALIEPNPQDWGWWVSYPLEQMGAESLRRGKSTDCEEKFDIVTTSP